LNFPQLIPSEPVKESKKEVNSMVRMSIKAFVFALALLSLPVLAQDSAATVGSPGCGNLAVKFSVKTDNGQNPAQPEIGKALVYFIEDDSNYSSVPKPTTRVGLDGKWEGATHGNSYLYFYVDPGVHHLCASWQPGGSGILAGVLVGAATGQISLGQGGKIGASSFTAEAGGVYYFEVKNIFFQTETSTVSDMSLTALNSDEGQLLASRFALSISKQKK
jgi:hypothetical protein